MALWQFITLTVLIGILLVYASVITRRLGGANDRLNRIEEALLAKGRALDSAATPVAEVATEVPRRNERRGSYLTLRDLRDLPTMRAVVVEDSVATSLEDREAPPTSSEPLDLPTMRAASEDSAATSLEGNEAPATNSEQQSPPGDHPPSDDSAAKKNRDMLLFLSNQRRRRRARLGY